MNERKATGAIFSMRPFLIAAGVAVTIVLGAVLVFPGGREDPAGTKEGKAPAAVGPPGRITKGDSGPRPAIGEDGGEGSPAGAKEARGPVPPFVGLDASGRITTGSIRALGLTDPEVDALTDVMSSFLDSVAEDFVARTQLLESRNAEDGVHYTYFTKARDDRGKGLLDGMRGKVEELLGEEKGGQFASSVGKSEISGSAGKYDIETLIIRRNGHTSVRQKYLNARNGAVVRTIEESGDLFKNRFGDLFEIPDE